MSKILVFITALLLLNSVGAYAGVRECVSTDADHALKVTLDQDANTITVNGEKKSVHPPAADGPKGVMVVTDPYDSDRYGMIYISVGNDKDGRIVISQVGAKDNKTKVSFNLDCK